MFWLTAGHAHIGSVADDATKRNKAKSAFHFWILIFGLHFRNISCDSDATILAIQCSRQKMDYGGSYQNSGGFGMASSSNTMSETEFQRLSQNVGTNIQKMIQNGKKLKMSRICVSYI